MKTVARVLVFPAYRDNPYINLLGLAARGRGYALIDETRLEGLERTAASLGAGDVVHLHWTTPVVQRAETVEEASGRLDRFRTAIDAAAARGARIVWTLHNVVPHDVRHDELELALCRYLADRADVVHVMTADAVEAAAPSYTLDPAKVVVIPHPSYQGVYPSQLSRHDARASIGLGADERGVLFFGQMRPYKGLDTLFAALGRLRATAVRPVLLLAGSVTEADRLTLEAILPAGVRVVWHPGHVADADVEKWLRAAEVLVLPYRRILNSGTLHLAATFDLPVVLPDEPHLRAAFGGETWIRWFDTEDPVTSIAGLLDDEATYAVDSAATRDFSHRLSPFTISTRYADLLDQLRATDAV
ncbi:MULTISPECIES: glycosyltransferase [unclassified Frondihabitans]|uniref:glycosyltransferase n=1 Tax=unclassified Frondihabitans TaxID=2626248 RepID=UPI000F4F5003|nr:MULTISPECIES: glycosyltransferase [unclassified Frondihabitans]RPE79047.1 glycosyltransferase involved in cell wall biosynthesis [Frondihabitans sp. PhB153]RPF09327.1 glycosyltransferase involved in cell wall biosynthesis [Frondihabitans sp. PhB161]